MEELVAGGLEELLPKFEKVCKCQRCRLDICAMALNNLPAKYVMTETGSAYAKLEAAKTQFQADVTRELVEAIGKVSQNPRH